MLNPRLLPPLLLSVRTALFPNNTLGPGRIPPTPVEAQEIKRACADTLIGALPDYVRSKFFATGDHEDMIVQTEELLDVFSDPYLNKHFVVAIVDLVVCRLFPELQDVGVAAQLREKLGQDVSP